MFELSSQYTTPLTEAGTKEEDFVLLSYVISPHPEYPDSFPKKLNGLLYKEEFNAMKRRYCQVILNIIAGKNKLDDGSMELLKLIEQGFIKYALFYIDSVKIEQDEYIDKYKTISDENRVRENERLLFSLRRSQYLKGKPNTCCYNCGKVLCRNGGIKKNPHYCVRSENSECFEEQKRKQKQKKIQNDFEWECIKQGKILDLPTCWLLANGIDLDKRECPFCERQLIFSMRSKMTLLTTKDKSKGLKTFLRMNHYHKVGNEYNFFCNEKEYMAYRKRYQRKNPDYEKLHPLHTQS